MKIKLFFANGVVFKSSKHKAKKFGFLVRVSTRKSYKTFLFAL